MAQTISINQHAYIEAVLERFNLTNTKPVLIPMEPNLQLPSQEGALTPKEAERIHAVPYAEAIGSVLWPAIISRPDVSYAVGALAHSIQNPTHRHWEALKQVIAYLGTTKDHWLVLGGLQDEGAIGYCDAD